VLTFHTGQDFIDVMERFKPMKSEARLLCKDQNSYQRTVVTTMLAVPLLFLVVVSSPDPQKKKVNINTKLIQEWGNRKCINQKIAIIHD
jgi:hypothetical protein